LPRALFTGAGKWLTALITTGAALAALLVNAKNLGLGSWLGSHGLGFADYAASRVIVTPRADSLVALGDTLMLSATVTDRRGASLTGSSLTWSSEDTTVVTVDSSGAVVAMGPGTTHVVATVRGVSAAARITVSQHVAALALSGDTLVRLPERDSLSLSTIVLDAHGYPVRGQVPTWSSGDWTVATVSPAGVVTGRAPGHTVVSVALEGHVARAHLDVELWPASLMLEAGDAQRVPAGHRVPEPIVVRVLSRSGRPVPNVAVAFRADDPDATLTPQVDTTNGLGRARIVWKLSSRPGRQHVAVSVGGVDSALIVVVEADPLARNTLIALEGVPPAGLVGRPLAEPIGIRVTDTLGIALADVPVIWTSLDGGRLDPLTERTDSAG
jgi:hypothetical protein